MGRRRGSGGVFFLFAGLAIAMLKMWNWMEMNRNTHTREIKRVEMQLAGLAEKTT